MTGAILALLSGRRFRTGPSKEYQAGRPPRLPSLAMGPSIMGLGCHQASVWLAQEESKRSGLCHCSEKITSGGVCANRNGRDHTLQSGHGRRDERIAIARCLRLHPAGLSARQSVRAWLRIQDEALTPLPASSKIPATSLTALISTLPRKPHALSLSNKKFQCISCLGRRRWTVDEFVVQRAQVLFNNTVGTTAGCLDCKTARWPRFAFLLAASFTKQHFGLPASSWQHFQIALFSAHKVMRSLLQHVEGQNFRGSSRRR